MKQYEKYMKRAIELAAKGWGAVSPNPMVGAVLVKNDKIVSEGYHKGAGENHAEAEAIKKAGKEACGADLIVNLEPCCHHGRTPPCTDLIIESNIKKVVYGMEDVNSIVCGKGLDVLKKAGVEVVGPLLEKECRSLNRIYIESMGSGRPYVISKVALSLDGKIAACGGDSKWITNDKCRKRMHYWRAGVDAVMVGAETVRKDDPLLDARGVDCSKQPRPVIVTASGDVGLSSRVFGRIPSPIIICGDSQKAIMFREHGMDVVQVESKKMKWQKVFDKLAEMGITSILVEGGAKVHSQMISEKLTKYMIASLSTKMIGCNGREWLPGWNIDSVDKSPSILPDQILVLDDNVVVEGEVDYRSAN